MSNYKWVNKFQPVGVALSVIKVQAPVVENIYGLL